MLEDSQFCHACGKEVTPSDECPSCHAKLVEGAKFCRKCGSALDQQEPQASPQTPPAREKPRKFFSDAEVHLLTKADVLSQAHLDGHLQGDKLRGMRPGSGRSFSDRAVATMLRYGFITEEQANKDGGIRRVMPDQRVIFSGSDEAKRSKQPSADLSNWPIASFGRRFGAYLIDVGIILGGVLLISAIAVTGASYLGLSLVAYAWILLYRPVSVLLFVMTLGKAMLGLRLVTDDNVPVMADRGKALGREIMWTIFAVIPICNLIWAAMTLADSKKQGWHDKLAGTLVVRR